MDDTNLQLHEHPRRRRRLAALLALSLVSGTIGAGALSLALFTDSDSSTGSFTTGTVVISTVPATDLFNVGALMPGDTVSRELTVRNTGTAQFRYAMTGSDTNTVLANQMTLRIYEGACGGGGTTVYNGALHNAAFGNPAQGPHAGDRVLAGGANEVLCFAAGLPLASGNAFQGLTVDVSFLFEAEQTANNP